MESKYRINKEKRELPREKLAVRGVSALSDRELLSILLGSGGGTRGVFELAKMVLPVLDSKNGNLSLVDLEAISGIGRAKACLLIACLEFARRRIRPEGYKVRQCHDALSLVQHFSDRKQEHFIVISLNGAHEVIAVRVVTVGLVNATQIHPREVFADAILDRACAVILAHNHPSGSLEPSKQDIFVTKQLARAGQTLGIEVLDHIIFSKNGVFSFKEHQMI